MVPRRFWLSRIEEAWKRRPLVWLSGVRRAGKTVISQSFPDLQYFDCELPSVRREMEDPEAFLRRLGARRLALDEVHRLRNPSEILKIAADHFPQIRILATGSSTLEASRKFRDTLSGRKTEIRLTPMMTADLKDFGNEDLEHRLARGGLPPFFLSHDPRESDFQEWMDSYWAKDIQELFRLERRTAFQRFLELLFVNSGGIFEATAYAGPCEISRPTVTNYLKALEATRVADVIRPFSSRRASEIISAPKVYAFDTGFVRFAKGWDKLRPEDRGDLWEHFVLNEIHARLQEAEVRYWRDKRGHEVDFVVPSRGGSALAIECKWSAGALDVAGLQAFRRRHPHGENWLVARDVDRAFERSEHGLLIECLGIREFSERLDRMGRASPQEKRT